MDKMKNNLFIELKKCQHGDKDAIYTFIQKFTPLLKKQAKRLNDCDGFEDLQLFLLEFIKSDKIDQINNPSDTTILSYIKKMIANYTTSLVKKEIRNNVEIPFSQLAKENESGIDIIMNIPSIDSRYLKIENEEMLNCLTKREKEILIYNHFYGYKVSELKEIYNVSQPAISQTKKSLYLKLGKYISESNVL